MPRQAPGGPQRTLVKPAPPGAELQLDAALYGRLRHHAELELQRVRLPVRDVEDLVNDSVLRYLEALDRVRKPKSWEAWLRSTIRNLVRERLRGGRDIMSRGPDSLDELSPWGL